MKTSPKNKIGLLPIITAWVSSLRVISSLVSILVILDSEYISCINCLVNSSALFCAPALFALNLSSHCFCFLFIAGDDLAAKGSLASLSFLFAAR